VSRHLASLGAGAIEPSNSDRSLRLVLTFGRHHRSVIRLSRGQHQGNRAPTIEHERSQAIPGEELEPTLVATHEPPRPSPHSSRPSQVVALKVEPA